MLTREGRFWERVDKNGPVVRAELGACWIWQGARDAFGYGAVQHTVAHRLSWLFTYGDAGDDCVLHRCDNPPCVNPAHLFVGDRLANAKDRDGKGRLGNRKGVANGHARLTEKDVVDIRALAASGEYSQEKIGRMYGINQTHVSSIHLRRIWSHIH